MRAKSFLDKIMEKKKGLDLVTSLFGLQDMFTKFHFLSIYHLGNFFYLIQSGV